MVVSTMIVLCAVLCVVFVTVAGANADTDDGHAPSFSNNKWDNPIEYVRKGNTKDFKCEASASPAAKYYWTLNGTAVTQDARIMSVDENTGTLTTGQNFDAIYTGDFRCYAFNKHGTAMTPIKHILPTVANPFRGSTLLIEDIVESESNYLEMKCKDMPLSIPPWQFGWMRGYIEKNSLVGVFVAIEGRTVIDDQGNLHFLWLEPDDDGYIYSCSPKNEIMLVLVQNTQMLRLTVNSGDLDDRPPELKYHPDVQVHAGQTAKLMCIFTYYSKNSVEKIDITWHLRGQLVVDKYNKPIRGETLTLDKVQLPLDPADINNPEGDYMCQATVGRRTKVGKVKLTIVAPPAFVKYKEPMPQFIPVGKDAVFQCQTTSHNAFSQPPLWFVDTVPLLGCPERLFECTALQSNGYSQCIEIHKVCDNLPDCTDDSDEHNCPASCPESQKRCMGKCIPDADMCTELICNFPGFMCRDKKSCLTSDKICNGNTDCIDGSDEHACPGHEVIVRGRYHINSQMTELTVPKVRIGESMCIQCTVDNRYGSVLGSGCLTVVDKIEIRMGPNSTYHVQPGTILDIPVEGTTERNWQYQLRYYWQWYVEKTNKSMKLTQLVAERLPPKGKLGQHFQITQNGKHMQMLFPEVKEDNKESYKTFNSLKNRLYTAVIYHKYDRVELNFTVTGDDLIPPREIPIVDTASSNLWFIALILAILLLFIVVALIVCYMHRNRGGTYPLDKKEHQAGHDPAQELKDSGFHDVGRVDDEYDDDKPGADNASLSEDVKPWDSDDDDPTEEYGFDVSKFNEEGSFIGLYVDKKGKYVSDAKEATV